MASNEKNIIARYGDAMREENRSSEWILLLYLICITCLLTKKKPGKN